MLKWITYSIQFFLFAAICVVILGVVLFPRSQVGTEIEADLVLQDGKEAVKLRRAGQLVQQQLTTAERTQAHKRVVVAPSAPAKDPDSSEAMELISQFKSTAIGLYNRMANGKGDTGIDRLP